MTCKSAIHRDCDVLTTIEERLTKKEATDSRVHERLAKLINEVMFEAKKPDEAKIKEKAIRFFAPNIAKALLSRKLMS